MPRTMRDIRERYDKHRNQIIASGGGSMSGIEYYPVPWDDLEIDNPSHIFIISTALSWNGTEHVLDPLRKRSDEEMDLHRRKTALGFKPWEQRKDEVAEIDLQLKKLKEDL